MKLMAGFLAGLAATLFTVAKVRAAERAPGRRRQIDLLNIFLTALVCAASLFLVSMVLPDDLAETAQALIGWCLAGTVAALALLAAVKGLEGLLDS